MGLSRRFALIRPQKNAKKQENRVKLHCRQNPGAGLIFSSGKYLP
jgi:hypothetical protein